MDWLIPKVLNKISPTSAICTPPRRCGLPPAGVHWRCPPPGDGFGPALSPVINGERQQCNTSRYGPRARVQVAGACLIGLVAVVGSILVDGLVVGVVQLRVDLIEPKAASDRGLVVGAVLQVLA